MKVLTYQEYYSPLNESYFRFFNENHSGLLYNQFIRLDSCKKLIYSDYCIKSIKYGITIKTKIYGYLS